MSTSVTVTGNLTRDPETKQLPDGVVVTKLRLAETERKLNRDTGVWEDVHTSYYTVSCFRTLAQRVGSDLKKGDPVVVTGRQQVRQWKRQDGCANSDTEILAKTVGVDLQRISVQVLRRDRTAAAVAPAPEPPREDSVDPWTSDIASVSEPAA